ncbi:hypothetical protein BaRGS_00007134 [Batillaria attramentaria]|uniref:Uncharacterized protein n=1 Tax=Batillaria attramentaria TaxID=370345 RepID=A0ABD0LRD7_9CAEN
MVDREICYIDDELCFDQNYVTCNNKGRRLFVYDAEQQLRRLPHYLASERRLATVEQPFTELPHQIEAFETISETVFNNVATRSLIAPFLTPCPPTPPSSPDTPFRTPDLMSSQNLIPISPLPSPTRFQTIDMILWLGSHRNRQSISP